MKKLLVALLLIATFVTGCNSYGKKYKVNDKSEVYYKGDGVTEDDAKKLGDFLLKNNYFDNETDKSVQLSKVGDTLNVKFVVDKQKVAATENAEMLFTIMGSAISSEVFAGKPVKVVLANEYMEGFKDIPVSTESSQPAQEDSIITIAPGDTARQNR